MPIEIRVPQLGESVVEATVGQWRKQPGQAVAAGEALVELETDKVNVEVAADQAGVLDRIDKPEGTNVQIGDLLGIFAEGATASAAVAAAPPPAPAPAESRPAAPNPPPAPTVPIQPVPVGRDGAQAAVPDAAGETGEATTASPAARHVAAEHGVDLNQVAGSGRGGRVTKEDVVTFVEQQRTGAALPPAAAPAPMPAPAPAPRPAAPLTLAPPQPEREERVRMSRRRQVIAQRLVEVQQIAAMLTTFNEVDMTAVMNLRRKRQEEFQKRHGVRLGFMSFFTKAVVGALKAQPYLNAEIQGDEVVLKRYYDVGIAVGAEGGLVVPVVRDADRKTFAQIERELGELAEKARQNTLKLEELQGGTFTITNGGIYGSLMSTPILNPPQVGILGMHKIQERPVASGGEVVIRPMMYLALSYDHRIVDGREAVTFLVRVKELIEDPESLLLEG